MGPFMIPANTKKGQLIFNLFKPIDLVILLSGIGLTLILLIWISNTEGADSTVLMILAVIPGVICAMLVVPIPNYHNIRVFIGELINYYSNCRSYKWRGWCSLYESSKK